MAFLGILLTKNVHFEVMDVFRFISDTKSMLFSMQNEKD